MDSNSYVKNLLDRGLLLTIYYMDGEGNNKFVFALKGNFINLIDSSKKLNSEKYYNICNYKQFNLDKNKISSILYNILPNNKDIDQIFLLSVDSLYKNKTYIKSLKQKYEQLKNNFKNYCSEKLIGYKNLSKDDIYDFYLLRFFPNHIKTKDNIYEKIKKDIDEKYFVSYDESLNEESNILAFKIFGISDKNLNVDNFEFVNALKRKWFDVIQSEKNKMIDKLKNYDFSGLNSLDKKQLKNEIEILILDLNKINIDVLNDFKTAKEVINYWPDLLEPKPNFVYEY